MRDQNSELCHFGYFGPFVTGEIFQNCRALYFWTNNYVRKYVLAQELCTQVKIQKKNSHSCNIIMQWQLFVNKNPSLNQKVSCWNLMRIIFIKVKVDSMSWWSIFIRFKDLDYPRLRFSIFKILIFALVNHGEIYQQSGIYPDALPREIKSSSE